MESNYAGSGRDWRGFRVAVSRGLAGDYLYDFEPFEAEAQRVRAEYPRAIVLFVCPLNEIKIAGFVPCDPDGMVIEVTPLPAGFLTKPRRIWMGGDACAHQRV